MNPKKSAARKREQQRTTISPNDASRHSLKAAPFASTQVKSSSA